MNINYINKKIDEYFNINFLEVADGNLGINLDMSINLNKKFNNIEIFTIPDKVIHDLFNECVKEAKSYIKHSHLNLERNYFYLTSKLISEKKESAHLFSPEFRNTFFGVVNLSNDPLHIEMISDSMSINSGGINIFSSSDKINILFNSNQRALCFNVSSFEFLSLQEPNRWLPII